MKIAWTIINRNRTKYGQVHLCLSRPFKEALNSKWQRNWEDNRRFQVEVPIRDKNLCAKRKFLQEGKPERNFS